MTHRAKRLWIALAVALLALLPAASLMAHDDKPADEEITLTGQLSYDQDMEAYVLIEEESGDSIVLTGSVDFAEHDGSKVSLTGKWAEDSEGFQYFEVSRIDPAAEEV